MFQRDLSILIIGAEDFGRVMERCLSLVCSSGSFVRNVAWEQSSAIWSPRLFQQTDLFVIEMYRQYTTGFRAEGVATAALILENGALPLIVAPFEIATPVELPEELFWVPVRNLNLSDQLDNLLGGSQQRFDSDSLHALAGQLTRDEQLFSLHQ